MHPHAIAALGVALLTGAASAQTPQTVVFNFPELPMNNQQQQLLYGFFGEDAVGGQIVDSRLYLTFETIGDFDAADLLTVFDVPVLIDNPTWIVSGADLGWSGQGKFTIHIDTDAFNGEVRPGKYEWFIGTPDEFKGVSGLFIESRYEFDVVPAPGTAAVVAGLAALALRRRRA